MPDPSRLPTLLRIAITLAAIAVPIVIQPGARDAFRTPKDLALAAAAIIVTALAACAWLLGGLKLRRIGWNRREALLIVASVCWVALTTLTSTNRVLSVESALRFGALLALILATMYVARSAEITLAWAFLLPALVNAVLMMSQAARLWSPFRMVGGRISVIGMLGNPDDAAGYLVAPVILAAALTMALPRRRLLYCGVTLVLIGGVLASQTITAALALAIALPAIPLVGLPRKRRKLGVALVAVIAICALSLPFTHPRLRAAIGAMRQSGFQSLGTSRTLPFFSAMAMAADHPLIGVGPGCFGYQYVRYELRAEEHFPLLAESLTRGVNFAEAHNDHLEILAETGFPGYALFVAALLMLARRSRGREGATPASETARVLGLPLAAGVAVLCAGHFALQLASSASAIAQIAAICIAWRHADEVA